MRPASSNPPGRSPARPGAEPREGAPRTAGWSSSRVMMHGQPQPAEALLHHHVVDPGAAPVETARAMATSRPRRRRSHPGVGRAGRAGSAARQAHLVPSSPARGARPARRHRTGAPPPAAALPARPGTPGWWRRDWPRGPPRWRPESRAVRAATSPRHPATSSAVRFWRSLSFPSTGRGRRGAQRPLELAAIVRMVGADGLVPPLRLQRPSASRARTPGRNVTLGQDAVNLDGPVKGRGGTGHEVPPSSSERGPRALGRPPPPPRQRASRGAAPWK